MKRLGLYWLLIALGFVSSVFAEVELGGITPESLAKMTQTQLTDLCLSLKQRLQESQSRVAQLELEKMRFKDQLQEKLLKKEPSTKKEAEPANTTRSAPKTINISRLPKEWRGFRGIEWGAKSADIPDLYSVDLKDGTNPKKSAYSRHGEKLGIGHAVLSRVLWVFYDGRLMNVRIDCKSNASMLMETLKVQYGEPEIQKDGSYIWYCTQDEEVAVFIKFEKGELDESATVSYVFAPILKEWMDNQKLEFEKAKDDL